MLLICYPKCSTCARAEKWMREKGIAYTYRDIKTDNPNKAELKAYLKRSGLPLGRLFNTSGMAYRQLGLKDGRKTMTEDQQLALLATDGMLVKRPILVAEDLVLVGFNEKEWENALQT